MIVTIDGYAGTGKSASALELARRLGFQHLNTGAMYRAVGFALIRAGVDIFAELHDRDRVTRLVNSYSFEMDHGRVKLNGEDVTEQIFTEAIGAAASQVGRFVEVRSRLKAEQRRLASHGDFVCEGRDQGTAVFPHAEVKFFLRASDVVRANRRVAQLRAAGKPADWDTVLRQIITRDRDDEYRPPELDPLYKAPDAIEVDTSHLTLNEVVQQLWEAVQQYLSKASAGKSSTTPTTGPSSGP